MKFVISREILLESINYVSKGLSSKTPMPVLTGIKIELSNHKIIFTTTNREVSVRVVLNENDKIIIEKEGMCVVPGKYFIDLIKKIEGTMVEFTLFEETTIKIISDRTNVTLFALEAKNFPQVNFDKTGIEVKTMALTMKQLIRQTAFAAGTSEARITLTGVCFDIEGSNLQVVATDSYRLAKKTTLIEGDYQRMRINIPNKALEELAKILDEDETELNLYITNNKVLFTYKNISFVTRLIEGTYPDTSSLFPQETLLEVTFKKSDLIATVDRASLFTNIDTSSIIRMNFNQQGKIQISSNSNEVGKVVDDIIPLNNTQIQQFQIAFSSKYFLEALKALESNEVAIKFTGEIKPFVLSGNKDEGLLQLILPVRIF